MVAEQVEGTLTSSQDQTGITTKIKSKQAEQATEDYL